MRKPLDDDYEICCERILDISDDKEIGQFSLEESKFFNKNGKLEIRKILICNNKQIFLMKDNKFILEIEKDNEVDYYYSYDLNDLI